MKERISGLRNESKKTKRTGIYNERFDHLFSGKVSHIAAFFRSQVFFSRIDQEDDFFLI